MAETLQARLARWMKNRQNQLRLLARDCPKNDVRTAAFIDGGRNMLGLVQREIAAWEREMGGEDG